MTTPAPRADFQPGDVVYLKSGSPPLTVKQVDANKTVTVNWVNSPQASNAAGSGVMNAQFPMVCLTDVQPPAMQFTASGVIETPPAPMVLELLDLLRTIAVRLAPRTGGHERGQVSPTQQLVGQGVQQQPLAPPPTDSTPIAPAQPAPQPRRRP